jgi:hypothetical protein
LIAKTVSDGGLADFDGEGGAVISSAEKAEDIDIPETVPRCG